MALPWPAMSGAEPWMGSNMDGVALVVLVAAPYDHHAGVVDVRTAHAACGRAAGNGGAQVGEDVAKEVARDDDLEAFRVFDHEHAGSVDEEGIGLDVRVFLAHFGEDLVPEDHGVVQGVALADVGQCLVFLTGQFIGIAHDSFAALAGEDAVLDDYFVGLVLVEPGTGAGVFAFAVFADEGHVNVFALYIGQGARCAFQQFDGTQVDVFIEIVADAKEQIPRGHAVGDVR